MRLRIPTASTYQRQLTSSPRSVRIRHRAASSSHSARVTPVWNRASVTRSNRSAIASRWLQDLLAERVTPGGDVVELLEHRHVDVRLDVAHHPGVPVPVPGAPDAARLVDDADPLDAGLAELGAGEHPGDPPAHDHDVDLVDDRVALDERRERVVTVAGEVLVGPQVADVGAAGDQPLVAFGEVLGTDGFGVVAARLRWLPPSIPPRSDEGAVGSNPAMFQPYSLDPMLVSATPAQPGRRRGYRRCRWPGAVGPESSGVGLRAAGWRRMPGALLTPVAWPSAHRIRRQ